MAKNKLDYVSVKTVLDNRGGARHRPPSEFRGSSENTKTLATFTVRVALATQQRGTRKLIITPSSGPPWQSNDPRIDDALIKALARAHRWKRMVERGTFASMTELAAVESVTESYLCRILRLNLLSPKIIEAALNGTLYAVPQLQQLVKPFSVNWHEQEAVFLSPPNQGIVARP